VQSKDKKYIVTLCGCQTSVDHVDSSCDSLHVWSLLGHLWIWGELTSYTH